jgi:glycine/D-amino acid oxidase-like deaminating enzyme
MLRAGSTEARVLARLCEVIVPGSAAIGPESYVRRLADGMTDREESELRAAIGLLGQSLDQGLAGLSGSSAFGLVRRLAIEAYYGDYQAPGSPGPTGHEAIGFRTPQTDRLRKDWSFLGTPSVEPAKELPERADVVVVGSGAGGGLIAAELGGRGFDVLLLEAGGLHPAGDHSRFELAARHDLWWPVRFARSDAGPIALLAGRCVGGSTVINTKVAMRAAAFERAAFPFELDPWYEWAEHRLGVRERTDWTPSVHTVRKGFETLGASLEPVRSYTDHNCWRCGACLQGCPTNAGKSALNTFIAPALGRGEMELRTGVTVERVLIEDGAATGVVANGRTVRARAVVLAAGALNTPQILLNSPGLPGAERIGRTLGLHPARLVYGRFDEPQDCHQVYPITAHCLDHQRDFLVEATTIQDPVSFAESLVEADGRPIWGARLTGLVAGYRQWAGLLVMATDDNTGVITIGPTGAADIAKAFSATERSRLEAGLTFAVEVLKAAGAREVVWTGLSTSHVQGTVPIGPAAAPTGRLHDVAGLYVGDGSLMPASLSVNPSLTIMALAAKVAGHVAEELK